MSVVLDGVATAGTPGRETAAGPVVTRAALAPELVAGRGATVAFDEQEAENAPAVHFKDVRVDGTGNSVLSARVKGSATFENVDARNIGAVGVNNCGSFDFPATGSEFALTDLGGNDGGWLAPWMLPATLTCDDRPPVVAPSAPSPW